MTNPYRQAAERITQADAILIGAGAGMGVDSGLPDFRGNEGFWKAYPPMKRLGLTFYDLASPVWFSDDPQQAWGFYGHRRNLYRESEPHAGFRILKNWIEKKPAGGFVFTSNVDGHFQKSGFVDDRIVECHGSIEFEQCANVCSPVIWKAPAELINVDMSSFRASGQLPACRNCNQVARPNILMFGDYGWVEDRTDVQYRNFESWLSSLANCQLVIIEIGAGTAVPTVRFQCQQIARRLAADHIRINPRESQGQDVISISDGGLQALAAITEQM